MLTSRLRSTLVAMAILGLVLASCAQGAAPTAVPKSTSAPAKEATTVSQPPPSVPTAPSPTSKPATDQPKYGGALKIGDVYDSKDYDYHQASLAGAQAPLAGMYNGLLQFDPVGDPNNMIPDLAEKWEISPDTKTYAFYLREDVKWHDGKPLSSEDVKFSIERQANPPRGMVSPRKDWFTGIDRIDIPDNYTVKITLQYARASFLPFMASAWSKILAKHVVEPLGDAKSAKAQIGTGPFKFKSAVPGTESEVVKNGDYFVKGRPYLEGVTRYVIADDATRFAAFRTHRINMASIFAYAFSDAQAQTVEKDLAGRASVYRFPAMVITTLIMNLKAPPFNDIRVRKAIALSLDRSKLKGVTIEEARVGGFFVPGGKWALPDDEVTKLPGFGTNKEADRAEARKLLADAGYPDGLKVRLLNLQSGISGDVRAQFYNDQLKTIGIQSDLDSAESARFYAELTDHRYTIAAFGQSEAIDDPDAWFTSVVLSTGARNYSQFSDKEIDDLIEKQSRTLDDKERKGLVQQAERKVYDALPVLPVYWYWGRTGAWNEVKNWKPGIGINERTMFQDVWIAG